MVLKRGRVSHSVVSNSLQPHGLYPTSPTSPPPAPHHPRLLRLWDFPRQEYWSQLPFPPPRDLPDPGIETTSHVSPVLQTDSLHSEPSGKTLSCI